MKCTIEATGQDGWMSFRYQYRLIHSNKDLFGYEELKKPKQRTLSAG
jgi:hypothetical protein